MMPQFKKDRTLIVDIKTCSGIGLDYKYYYQHPQFVGEITEAENGCFSKIMELVQVRVGAGTRASGFSTVCSNSGVLTFPDLLCHGQQLLTGCAWWSASQLMLWWGGASIYCQSLLPLGSALLARHTQMLKAPVKELAGFFYLPETTEPVGRFPIAAGDPSCCSHSDLPFLILELRCRPHDGSSFNTRSRVQLQVAPHWEPSTSAWH